MFYFGTFEITKVGCFGRELVADHLIKWLLLLIAIYMIGVMPVCVQFLLIMGMCLVRLVLVGSPTNWFSQIINVDASICSESQLCCYGAMVHGQMVFWFLDI